MRHGKAFEYFQNDKICLYVAAEMRFYMWRFVSSANVITFKNNT